MTTMIANNSKLLKIKDDEADKKKDILKKLEGMDTDKLAAIMKLLE